MSLLDLLSLDAVVTGLKVSGKKQVLQELAAKAAALSGVGEREILDALMQRERLGSTGVGHGVAIPHAKLAGLGRLFGVFARLDRPVHFEAIDDQSVDLVFVLLAPAAAGADHLKALARIARLLRDPGTAAKLRSSHDASAIFALLTESAASHAA